MMVKPTSRMSSAISFGVFWRSAPSTSLIMRSRKVEPGAAVMRTLIQSDSTWVPPVTAERSPPDSRMTGADSPVIAASFTEAMPSTTSPSDGMVSPASTSDHVADLEAGAGDPLGSCCRSAPVRSLAWVSVRVRRSASACALPRPSAIASAKLANSTVNHSHRTIWNSKPRLRASGHEVADQDDGGERGDDLEHEHDRILHQGPRIELDEGRADRRNHDLGIEQRRDRHAFAQLRGFHRRDSEISSMRTGCRRSSRNARRSGRARAPGRKSGRR